jgi:predicted Rossmann-fold nucleotide-binding protein
MRPIIAVFGGSVQDDAADKVLKAAEHIGCQIGRQGCIVLTGASGPSPGTVKGEAVRGADRAAREGFVAPWIGVPQQRDGSGKTPDLARCIVLPPAYDDRRNYLEAFICDAAIVLPGSEGTMSEAALCLGLGRPIVLAGQLWMDMWPVAPGDEGRAAFLAKARERVKHSKDGAEEEPIQRLIDSAYDELMIAEVLQFRTAQLPETTAAAALVVEIAVHLAGHPNKRALPELCELAPAKERFDPWYDVVQEQLVRNRRGPQPNP